jgi:hypothetical protein
MSPSLDEIVLISKIARFIERFDEERLWIFWCEALREDAVTQRVVKAAIHAVRTRRLIEAPSANLKAA